MSAGATFTKEGRNDSLTCVFSNLNEKIDWGDRYFVIFFLAVGTFNVYTVTTGYKGSFQEEIGVIRSHL